MSNKPNRFSNLALFAHIGTFPTRNLNKNLFCTSDVSTHSRYIPDTYPTHTRYICIPHEYSPNTPRIPHEYPTQRISMREVTFSSPLAVVCTAVARRVVIPCLAFASGLASSLVFYVYSPGCHSGVPCIVFIVFIVDLPPFSLAGTLIASAILSVLSSTPLTGFVLAVSPRVKKIAQMRAFSCTYQKKAVPL